MSLDLALNDYPGADLCFVISFKGRQQDRASDRLAYTDLRKACEAESYHCPLAGLENTVLVLMTLGGSSPSGQLGMAQ